MMSKEHYASPKRAIIPELIQIYKLDTFLTSLIIPCEGNPTQRNAQEWETKWNISCFSELELNAEDRKRTSIPLAR